ncbi:MAG: DUF4873 domain-containing protein [Streptosporangiales bacterium]|nr:DUF4873 domain-containing protein [Streptosporangiales bacterium]
MSDDGYTGPATLEHADVSVSCDVVITGFFEPITGRYKWYGRASGSASASDSASGSGLGGLPHKGVVLRTPHGTAETTVSDEDFWGRWRLQGFGAPPFPRAVVGADD